MLYEYLYPLYKDWTPLNLFKYITVRAALAAMMAFVVSLVVGPFLIRWLRSWKIREDTSKTDSKELARLHADKKLTPTMGGILILFAVGFAVVMCGRLDNAYVTMGLTLFLCFGLIGFWDDYIKLTRTGKSGLSGRIKFLWTVGIALLVSYGIWVFAHSHGEADTVNYLYVPIGKKIKFFIAWLFIPFGMLVMVSTSHAVNLTDGLDGLAIGCTILVCIAFCVIVYVSGHRILAQSLGIHPVKHVGELAVFAAAILGAGMGFLWFNCHPADVFMGDTGSLALGGSIGYLALASRHELLLVIGGGVFVIEALSVIIQVVSFKTTGRRVFRIAPIHHHFQFGGWNENKVTVRFWIIAAILSMASVLTLKIR